MRRAAALLPLLLAAALVAGGCGGVTLDPVARAASRTADAGSFRFSFSITIGAGTGSGQQRAAITGTGAYDASNRRLQADVDLASTSLGVVLDASAASPAIYFRPPPAKSQLPAGKTWAKVDLAAAAKQNGLDLGKLTSAQLDPRQLVSALQRAGHSTTVGNEEIDGVSTTHYRVEIDPQKAIQKSSAAQKDAAAKALQVTGLTTLPVDVWVDGSGLLRRVAADLGGGLFSLHASLDLRDYGADVAVDLPPADEVADAPATLPSLLPTH